MNNRLLQIARRLLGVNLPTPNACRTLLVQKDDPRAESFKLLMPTQQMKSLFGRSWEWVTAVALAIDENGEVIGMGRLNDHDDYCCERPTIMGVWARGAGNGFLVGKQRDLCSRRSLDGCPVTGVPAKLRCHAVLSGLLSL